MKLYTLRPRATIQRHFDRVARVVLNTRKMNTAMRGQARLSVLVREWEAAD